MNDPTNENESANLKDLAGALCKAQASIGAAKRDGKNPHFGSTFATLEAVLEAISEPLAENGLSCVQLPIGHPTGIALRTILLHESGQWIAGTMTLPFDTQKGRTEVQAAGSTITYMRRYALMSLLGVPTEDDDGNAAGETYGNREARGGNGEGSGGSSNGEGVSEAQVKLFKTLTNGLSADRIRQGLKKLGHECGFADLSKREGSAVITALKDSENG